jgi:hypothetical protein
VISEKPINQESLLFMGGLISKTKDPALVAHPPAAPERGIHAASIPDPNQSLFENYPGMLFSSKRPDDEARRLIHGLSQDEAA